MESATTSRARVTGSPAEGSSRVRSTVHAKSPERPALPVEGHLPSLSGATAWLNSSPLTPLDLRGRVVLIDFWTYTCVNWLRTLPYLREWAAKYQEAGLTVIGVHTPEFGFEHDIDNVAARARAERVFYPVAVDNDYVLWNAFANHFWPALYVADADGRIRYHHFGEGEYAMAEMVLQQLLEEAGATTVNRDLVDVEPVGLEVAADWRNLRSPETYVGRSRGTGFASASRARWGVPHEYLAEPQLRLNSWDLSGTWTVAPHAATLNSPGGSIAFQYRARDVNLVMGPGAGVGPAGLRVSVDGQPVDDDRGADVGPGGMATAAEQRCFQLVRHRGRIDEHRVEIEFSAPGVEVFCFTFG